MSNQATVTDSTVETTDKSNVQSNGNGAKAGLEALSAMMLKRAAAAGATATELQGIAGGFNESLDTEDRDATEHLFRVGWSYDVFLKKNAIGPSERAQGEWKRLSREASKSQVDRMAQLTGKGFKTVCKRSAIWNGKAKCYDTALTARVVEPDCNDADLIRDAYVKAQARQAKLLSSMRAAAIEQGADIGE